MVNGWSVEETYVSSYPRTQKLKLGPFQGGGGWSFAPRSLSTVIYSQYVYEITCWSDIPRCKLLTGDSKLQVHHAQEQLQLSLSIYLCQILLKLIYMYNLFNPYKDPIKQETLFSIIQMKKLRHANVNDLPRVTWIEHEQLHPRI